MKLAFLLFVVLVAVPADSARAQGVLYRGPGEIEPPAEVDPLESSVGGLPPVNTPFSPGPDLTQWQFWWEFNRAPYLAELIQQRRVLAKPKRPVDWPRVAPELARLSEEVTPALLRSLGTDQPAEVVGATLIALAKIGQQPKSEKLAALLAKYLDDKRPNVAESAVLGLGILGDDTSVRVLVDLLENTPAGHRVSGSEEVPNKLRAFAATSLGMLGGKAGSNGTRRWIYDSLMGMVGAKPAQTREVRVACLLAIGHVPLESREACKLQIDALLGILEDQSYSGSVRCHAADSASKLLRRLHDEPTTDIALARLLRQFHSKPTDRLVQPWTYSQAVWRSCVVAIGELADGDPRGVDVLVRSALIDVADLNTDTQARSLSSIALASIASRSPHENHSKALLEISSYLAKQVKVGRNSMRPWAAVASGLLIGELGENAPDELVATLRAALAQERTPRVAAYAIGAALSGRRDFTATLIEKFEKTRDGEARGYLALAIGMLGEAEGQEVMAEAFFDSPESPLLQVQLVIALGLNPTEATLATLIEELKHSESAHVQAALATAIGELNDRRAIAPLLKLIASDTATGMSRASAVQALGILGRSSSQPWHAKIASGFNYRATTPALTSATDLGLLRFL